MADNTCTSGSGTVTGTDPSFAVAYATQPNSGVVLYVKYTKGTEAGVTLTFDVINKSLHATDKYRHVSLSGVALSPLTMTLFATGNYRIPLPVIAGELSIIANVVFSAAGQGGAVVANFMES